MTLVVMLQGPLLGKVMNVRSTDATAGIADGWCKAATGNYPWASSPYSAKVKPAASYDAWVAAGSPAADPVTGAVVRLTKANPSVMTLSPADFVKFGAGDKVVLSGTGVTAIHGPQYTLSSPNATNKTFVMTGLDLSAQGADITQGTVTKG